VHGELANLTTRLNSQRVTPVGTTDIDRVLKALSVRPPEDYVEFMSQSGGAEGFIDESYLILWPVEQLEELNTAYHVTEFAPGLVLFGSDGADTAYGFDTRSGRSTIVAVPFIGMSLDQVEVRGHTFLEFLQSLAWRQ
jgi:hypothetical protein